MPWDRIDAVGGCPRGQGKHLALIQGRHHANGEQLVPHQRGDITVVAGLTALATGKVTVRFAWIAVVVGIIFALLDVLYLAFERAYGTLYAGVVAGRNTNEWTLDPGPIGPSQVFAGLTAIAD